VGHDLGTLSHWLDSIHCTTFACKLAEGVLTAVSIPLQNLDGCEKDLKQTESDFTAGAVALSKMQVQSALTYWSNGINSMSTAATDCGLNQELAFMQQEANVLGFGNSSGTIGSLLEVVIHGEDLSKDISGVAADFESHDYRSAGVKIGKIMNELSNYTSGHNCKNDFCYVVTGIMQFMGDIQGDVRACETDFELAWHNITAAFGLLQGGSSNGNSDFTFNTDTNQIRTGVRHLGFALQDIAKGVSDCHLTELAEALTTLGVKLGIVPEVGWIEELLHILIEGVHIEQELGDACLDYSNKNWVGFGYNIAKLTETLVVAPMP